MKWNGKVRARSKEEKGSGMEFCKWRKEKRKRVKEKRVGGGRGKGKGEKEVRLRKGLEWGERKRDEI